jgi:putative membrane protein
MGPEREPPRMTLRARDHVPALTAALTLASLALVFGAALRVLPASALPRAPDAVVAAIPHVNAAVSLAAVAVIARGWLAVRRGDVAGHRRAMLAAVGLFAAFLALYLYRVALEGPTHFDGPAAVRRFVYLPVLAVHVTLAVVCIPLVYYVLLLATTHPVADLRDTLHPRVGRIAAALWLVSFALGVVTYLLLYVAYG